MTKLYFILCNILIGVAADYIEGIPTKHEITYINPKFFKDVVITIKRIARGKPYSVHGHGYLLQGVGDNVTVTVEPFENVQGRYIPQIGHMELQLCKFYNEPYIGKRVVQRLPQNLTKCPVPPGYYAGTNVLELKEDFPFHIPFTYESIYARGKIHISGFMTTTKEPMVNVTFYGIAIQRPRNRKI